MPSIESILTRELDLRFIDARNIATEARIALGIEGYITKDQIDAVRDEAVRIFQDMTDDEQRTLRRNNWDLEASKVPAGSIPLSDWIDSASDHNSTTSSQSRSVKSGIRSILSRRR